MNYTCRTETFPCFQPPNLNFVFVQQRVFLFSLTRKRQNRCVMEGMCLLRHMVDTNTVCKPCVVLWVYTWSFWWLLVYLERELSYSAYYLCSICSRKNVREIICPFHKVAINVKTRIFTQVLWDIDKIFTFKYFTKYTPLINLGKYHE